MPEITTQTRYHFRGPSQAGAPRLAGLPGVERAEPQPVEVLEVERYDTDDMRLGLAGIVLALHRDADGARWQLDLPDGGDARERLRVPLAADAPDPAPVPEELEELVTGASRDRAVRPVGRIRTSRTVTRLLGDSAPAEVAHDQVTVATLGSSTEVQSWTEAAVDAPEPLRAAVIERLSDSGLRPARPGAEAELARLLRPVAPTRSRAGKKGSAGVALIDYVATQIDRLAAEDLRVRRDEPDAVHQMRVASRRLRSALRSYGPLLDAARTAPLEEGLRTLGRALAPARDAEVLRERISAGLADLDPALLLGPVAAQTTRHFARTEAEARAAVLTELDSDRYADLRSALDAFVAHPPLTERAARPARRELPALVARSARRLEKAVAAATDPALADRDDAVHAARKAGKRLRYATEVARPTVGKPAKRFATQLKAFQSALGEHQDTVVARVALRELGASAENGFSFGVLLGKDATRAAELERSLPGLWAQAWTPKRRRWLRR